MNLGMSFYRLMPLLCKSSVTFMQGINGTLSSS